MLQVVPAMSMPGMPPPPPPAEQTIPVASDASAPPPPAPVTAIPLSKVELPLPVTGHKIKDLPMPPGWFTIFNHSR